MKKHLWAVGNLNGEEKWDLLDTSARARDYAVILLGASVGFQDDWWDWEWVEINKNDWDLVAYRLDSSGKRYVFGTVQKRWVPFVTTEGAPFIVWPDGSETFVREVEGGWEILGPALV